MQLFVLRHGQAEGYATSDSARNLTERGRSDTIQIITFQKDALAGVNCIYASPYNRAQQTAVIAAEILGLPVQTCDVITPEHSVRNLLGFLEGLPLDPDLFSTTQVPLLVSHQPLVGSFVDWFCGFERGGNVMGTSALAAIQYDVLAGACGDLISLTQP